MATLRGPAYLNLNLVLAIRLGGLRRRDRWFEHQRQNLVNPLDEVNDELRADVLGNVVEIGLVASRQQHDFDPRAMRGQELLFDTAAREHASAERDLTG